ncbi:fluoride efflux transporter FluC [Salimicrobium flavidum]|uniref:Fluoride-specific ion channel FluC n=1 Tax=Salimicrobium flavidum TaxID=570947 RepID=A0A1N7J6F0_9BACI|nr:CrcB family protein [Salimicrobium flavidum]SIS44884.1 camphor resistance protein CrcB [Salimicrobium flavidum]
MMYFYIAVFGFIGATLRYMTGELFFRPEAVFPFSTLTVNLIGTFLLSWFTFRAPVLSEQMRKAIGTGLLGSFTTFSMISVETVSMIETEVYLAALLYISLTIFGGLSASFLGFRLGERGRE